MVEQDATGWTLTSAKRRVDQIQLDYRFGILFDDSTLIAIEGRFHIRLDEVDAFIDPERVESATVATGLLHRTVVQTRALQTGMLVIDIEGGGRIEVAPGDDYENWNVVLPSGDQYIGLPGGGVAHFGPP